MSLEEFSDLELQNIGHDEKKPPRQRVKDARAAQSIYKNLKQGDQKSNAQRQRVQAMFDGTPPYSDATLKSMGQGFRTNVNFGEGENYLEEGLAAYVDMITSTDSLVRIETNFGEEKERKEWNRIMSEEYSFQLRTWPNFNFQFLNLCLHFVGHGVGINYFDDAGSWKWRSSGLGDFLLPRQTPAFASAIEVACAERRMTTTELYRNIENADEARALGWNIKPTVKAIKEACDDHDQWDGGLDWEKFQAEVKNNDLYLGSKTAKVKVVHMWVREFDQSITHIIARQEGDDKEFLYHRPNKYKNIQEAFTFFTFGIGTNGTFHSIRGLGYKIFSQIQLNNRIRSQAVDNAMLAGSPMLQATDEHALEDLAFNYFGPFAIMPPGVEVMDRAIPNVSTTMMPVLEDLSNLTQRRTGQYSSQGVFGKDQRKTRFEVAAQLEQNSKLSATSQNLFYAPWDAHNIEVARRFHNPDYVEAWDGYEEVAEYRDRCLARGVPEEALMAVDHKKTRAVRAVGNGSQSNRIVQLQQLNELAGTFDEEGRHNLHRDQTAAVVGQEAADRYIPARPSTRVTHDARIALLETNDLLSGREFEPFPDDLHLVHLEIHTPKMEEVFQQVQEGQIDLIAAYQQTVNLFHHCVSHLEFMQSDFSVAHRVNEFNERLQQLSELIINGRKAYEKQMREEQEAAEQGEGQGQQQQVDPAVQMKLMEASAKLDMMREKHEQELYMKMQKHQQEMAIQDAKAAASVKEFLK